MRGRVFIVDGSSVLYRSFYALPRLTNSSGLPTNAIYGFHNILRKLIREEKPDYLVVAFDVKGKTVRHELFEQYKAQRKPMPDELQVQIPYVKKLLEALRIPYIEEPRYEADDLMASLAKKLKAQGYEVIIVTSDKDLLQVLEEGIKIYHPGKEKYIDHENCEEFFGVKPEQVADVLALMGDPVDNVPGVKGIGEKTAKSLIKKFSSLDNLLKNLEKVPPRQRKAILSHMQDLKLSRELVKIDSSLPVDINLEELRIKEPDLEKLLPLLRELEFNSLLKEYIGANETKGEFTVLEKEGEVKKILSSARKLLSVVVDGTDKRPMWAKVSGISISLEPSKGYYIPVKDHQTLSWFQSAFSNPDLHKYGHDLKYQMVTLAKEGLYLRGPSMDSMLLSYLLWPEKKSHSLEAVALEILGVQWGRAAGGGEAAEIALRLCNALYPKLKEEGLEEVYKEIELPLVEVLAHMEVSGVKIDVEKLGRLSRQLEEQLKSLEEEIHRKAGVRFNINSPKQLGEVLFEKLRLPLIKKTKKTKGYSTDMEVLKELSALHEVPALVLQYRQLAKIKSTYIDPLPGMIHPKTGRIHTTYHQTGTATGRLSSSDPNLQNIPIRGELGKKVREAFVAEEGYLLLSADYSQIELRVVAHMSGDEKLIKAFKEGQDIHRATAEEVFGDLNIPEDEKRRRAKIINFSIIYGTSAYSLSKELGVDVHQAADFINKYFEKYPKVKEYIDKTVAEAKEKGYVRTLFGRKRRIPELRSPNKNIQAAGARIAMNTPIQGTAADIMKKAMIGVYRKIQEMKSGAKIIMQVHDELILEVPEKEIGRVKEEVKQVMENVVSLKVPLVVDIAYGKNWREAKA